MSRSRKVIATIAILVVPVFVGGFLVQARTSHAGALLLDQVLSLVSDRYVDTLEASAIYEKAAHGLVRELNDPYSQLFTPKEYKAFNTNTGGHYGGIGMQIEDQQGWITISKVFPNTPAEAAGVREGDRIVLVDTLPTRGWSLQQTSDYLTGIPGTKVKVRFARPGVSQPIDFQFTRAVIRIPAVPYALMLTGNIGYVPLLLFSETAAAEVSAAVQSLMKQGAKGLILDERGNPGGILDQSLTVSNLFLTDGQEILSVRGRAGATQTLVAKGAPVIPSAPIIVLTDGGTASAAEIVAGALPGSRPGVDRRPDELRQGPGAVALHARRRLCAENDDRQVVHAKRPNHPARAQVRRWPSRRNAARFERKRTLEKGTSHLQVRRWSRRVCPRPAQDASVGVGQ